MEELVLTTTKKTQLVEVTAQVNDYVKKSGVKEGICVVYTPHTTCGLTINENADPDVRKDMLKSLDDIVKELDFHHIEGNSVAHVKSSLIGCEKTILISDYKPVLGTWQGIYLCEFDGPRSRKLCMKLVSC